MARKYVTELGCGTLIIIAIIVAVFSGTATNDLESEISSLRSTVVATSSHGPADPS